MSWQHVVAFYHYDTTYQIRGAPKQTNSHINPSPFEKMNVKLASQVFSTTVVANLNLYVRFGYIPAEATWTAQFIEWMDRLFDILN